MVGSQSIDNAVELIHVSKRYLQTGEYAVSDVSFAVRRGEFVTILGPSGSGKSTLLALVAGFEWASSGRISLNGRDVTTLSPRDRNVGMVFQDYALFPHMSVIENVAFPLKQRRIQRRERLERCQRMLDSVGLSELANRPPRQLSGGQRQRVALARALVYDPTVLLLDEPLSALDRKLRRQMQDEVARVHRESGVTSLFVTHDQEEALSLSDRVAVLHRGCLEQLGTPDELYRAPKSLFVATFVGDANVFTAVSGDDPGLVVLPDQVPSDSRGLSSMIVVVRPEHVVVTPGTAAIPSGYNGTAAVIEQVAYLGSDLRISLQFSRDGSQGSALVRTSLAETWCSVGDSVLATWRREDQMVFAGGAQADALPGEESAATQYSPAETRESEVTEANGGIA